MSSPPDQPDSTPFDDADTAEIDDFEPDQGPAEGDETSEQIDTGDGAWPPQDEQEEEESGWDPDNEEEGEWDPDGDDDEGPYVPPETLPPPYPSRGGLPLFATLLSLIIAAAMGAALVGMGRVLYVPLIYNVIVGVALGWAVSKAPKWSNFTSGFLLFLLLLVCTLLVYVISHVGTYIWIYYGTDDYRHFFEQSWQRQWEEVRAYLLERAAVKKAFGYPLGLYGTTAVWAGEALITLAVGWLFVRPGIRLQIAESVPVEVLEMVLNLQADGYAEDGVRDELKLRGWGRSSDQSRALRAATAYDKLVGNR